MDRNAIIDSTNAFKNTPIAPQKSNVLENSSGDKFDSLMQYNAMLDNVTIGAHTNMTINYANKDWTLRLLTAAEFIQIKKDIHKECKNSELWEGWYIDFLTLVKVLQLALTPSPFKLEGEGIQSETTLATYHYGVLEAVYMQYLDFVQKATQKPDEFTVEEVEAFVTIAKKKPELLKDYERPKLLAVTYYFMKSLLHLEKMVSSD